MEKEQARACGSKELTPLPSPTNAVLKSDEEGKTSESDGDQPPQLVPLEKPPQSKGKGGASASGKKHYRKRRGRHSASSVENPNGANGSSRARKSGRGGDQQGVSRAEASGRKSKKKSKGGTNWNLDVEPFVPELKAGHMPSEEEAARISAKGKGYARNRSRGGRGKARGGSPLNPARMPVGSIKALNGRGEGRGEHTEK